MKSRQLGFLAFLLLATGAICAVEEAKAAPPKNPSVISALRDCTRRYPKTKADCETIVERAIVLFERGNKNILDPLMDLGLKSDRHLSEMLGIFLGENVLAKHPRLFLSSLATRTRKQQRDLSFLAATMDGSGMPKDMFRSVRAKLLRISRLQNDPLAPLAKLFLSIVLDANKIQR